MNKYLDFVKAHYEKVILSIVLLGLAAAAALMPMKVSEEQQREQQRKSETINPRVTALQPIVLTNALETLARVAEPTRIKLSGEHNVFNPVRWQKRPDGGVVKGADAGVNALTVAEIKPLRQVVSFRRVVGNSEPYKYEIGILDESERPSVLPRLGEVGRANPAFRILTVKGDPQNPTEIELVLQGERTPITITPDKPFERVVGYAADLHHQVENRKWPNLKVKDDLSFGGESYNIVAITEDEVVLSAKSNKKQTPIEYTPEK